MSSQRVGQGRVYVRLGETSQLDFPSWCDGLASGRSYVSDGYAHALEFDVDGVRPGDEKIAIAAGRKVAVRTQVAFAPIHPLTVAQGTLPPTQGPRMVGDTRVLHAPRDSGSVERGVRLIEVIANGQVVASAEIVADGEPHALAWEIPIERSTWIAVRHFPQLHTNPVIVEVAGEPIRASRGSAVWCMEATKRLWQNRSRFIDASERPAAQQAYERALRTYASIATECPSDGSPIPAAILDTPPQDPLSKSTR